VSTTIANGSLVWVALAQEIRAYPGRDVTWYRAVVHEVAQRGKRTGYRCTLEFHADKYRWLTVRTDRQDEPNKDYDAIRVREG
jgi:hypothetical protein